MVIKKVASFREITFFERGLRRIELFRAVEIRSGEVREKASEKSS